MSNGAAQLILSTVAVILGGSAVQLIVFVFRKRADLANVDASTQKINAETEKLRSEAEKLRSDAAAEIASGLADVAALQIERNKSLEKRIDLLQKDALRVAEEYERTLRDERIASSRLSREVATLRNEVATQKLQIIDLQARLAVHDRDPSTRTRRDDA